MIISFYFFAVLIAGAILYWLIPEQKYRSIFLSVVSILFIGYFDKYSAIIVIILSIYSYLFAILITANNYNSLYHKIGIIGLILVLIVFKYLGFLSNTICSITSFLITLPKFQFEKLLLPLGISYIIFKHISYLTDVYWKVTDKGNFSDVLCYSSLFTIYTAGPIERFERFMPQIREKMNFDISFLEKSFERIVYGLFKKLVIADWIGYLIDPVWKHQSNYSIGMRALALLGYSIQVYTDFAGYSDIAIGSSQLFGLKIMENFDKPYIQKNIVQFWRHWHISLSDWLRDYIFFPLSSISGNKMWALFLSPVITMAACGLWHGAAWHYVLWGLWHGLGIAVYQTWNYYKKKKQIQVDRSILKIFNYLSILFTFIFVSLGWLLFL